MRIIDRYILRQFLQNFVICFLSLTGIIIVFDAFTNLDAFFHRARGLQLLKFMGVYYSFQSIAWFDQMSSLLVLMAAMFTVAWIQRHNEMTALMAAGITRVRIVAPVMVAALVITALSVINRELVMPRFQSQIAKRPADLQDNAAEDLSPQPDWETDVLIGGKLAYTQQKRIEKAAFTLPRTLGEYGWQLTAANAYYKEPTAITPGGYLLDGVLEPKNLAHKPSLALNGHPVLVTPRDRPDWLGPNQAFLVSKVTFDKLTGDRAFRLYASTSQLIAALRDPSYESDTPSRVKIHARLVQPLLDVTLLFLGLPLVVAKERRNVFAAIGLCMGVVTLFLLFMIGFRQMGGMGFPFLSPSLAAWAPLLMFVPAAVGLSETMWER